ncbi:MAG TPA: ATP-dependent Clp protease proteolytic subunit [Anaerolineae bacterium]|nr:ATP-dependent Clp protease proteolytic subunit [Anaerolineae bacterium]MCB9104207.1 ATP-dependent Clp protease proteolytic subunit [Anaerolineales bacterium]HRV91159.1 ATP-dependent Clp protease proteolytic subunit [Anaerolineae bacterium]
MFPKLPEAMVPMVIESTGRTERAYDIFSLLLRERIIFLGTPINDQIANLIVAQLLYLNREDPEREIQMYINSPGGVIYAGLAIYDTMQQIQAPIHTFAVGVTASMGTVLLAAGASGYRYALPHATIHMHQAGGGAQGYTTDVEIQYREMKRQQDLLFGILSKHTGQTISQIADDFERDRWMDAITAKEYGLVDDILGEAPASGDSSKDD